MLRILWKKQKIFLPVFNRLIRIRKNSLLCIIDNYIESVIELYAESNSDFALKNFKKL